MFEPDVQDGQAAGLRTQNCNAGATDENDDLVRAPRGARGRVRAGAREGKSGPPRRRMRIESVGAVAILGGPRGRHHVSLAVVAFEISGRELRRTRVPHRPRLRPRLGGTKKVKGPAVRHLRQGGQGRQELPWDGSFSRNFFLHKVRLACAYSAMRPP